MISGVDLRYTNSKTWEFLRHDWNVRMQTRTWRGGGGGGGVEAKLAPPLRGILTVCACCVALHLQAVIIIAVGI